MAIDYDELAAIAQALIEESGRSIQLVRLKPSASDPGKPWRGATNPRSSTENASVAAVAVDPRNATALGFTMKDSDFVKKAEAIYLVADAEGKDLKAFHEVVDGASRYRIEEVQELRPGDRTLLYYVVVSR